MFVVISTSSLYKARCCLFLSSDLIWLDLIWFVYCKQQSDGEFLQKNPQEGQLPEPPRSASNDPVARTLRTATAATARGHLRERLSPKVPQQPAFALLSQNKGKYQYPIILQNLTSLSNTRFQQQQRHCQRHPQAQYQSHPLAEGEALQLPTCPVWPHRLVLHVSTGDLYLMGGLWRYVYGDMWILEPSSKSHPHSSYISSPIENHQKIPSQERATVPFSLVMHSQYSVEIRPSMTSN